MNQEFIEFITEKITQAKVEGNRYALRHLSNVKNKYIELHPSPQTTTLQGIEITADILDVSDMD